MLLQVKDCLSLTAYGELVVKDTDAAYADLLVKSDVADLFFAKYMEYVRLVLDKHKLMYARSIAGGGHSFDTTGMDLITAASRFSAVVGFVKDLGIVDDGWDTKYVRCLNISHDMYSVKELDSKFPNNLYAALTSDVSRRPDDLLETFAYAMKNLPRDEVKALYAHYLLECKTGSEMYRTLDCPFSTVREMKTLVKSAVNKLKTPDMLGRIQQGVSGFVKVTVSINKR